MCEKKSREKKPESMNCGGQDFKIRINNEQCRSLPSLEKYSITMPEDSNILQLVYLAK